MHACRVLQKLLSPALSVLDARTVRNLLQAVEACLSGRRLVMMELARHWPGAIKVAAPLKRLDRLLANPRVHALRVPLYEAIVRWVVRGPTPAVIVDWSELKSDGRWLLLRAGVAVGGRTVTLYEEAHPQHHLGAPGVHKAFLARLQRLLPGDVRPIVVTDAGFKVPWFREVEALGWHWLGRVRGHVGLRPAGHPLAPFRRAHELYRKASSKPRALGRYELTASHGLGCDLVVVRRPRRHRHQRLRRAPERARGGREPWLLACSPTLQRTPAQLARAYALRMQIESSFRDLKSHRYGCAFEDTQTRSAARLEMLLLIHMLATLLAWLAALATRGSHETRFRMSLLRRGWEYLRESRSRFRLSPLPALGLLAHTIRIASEGT